MAKPVISVLVYQIGSGIALKTPKTMGCPINSRTVISPVDNSDPEVGVGTTGAFPNPSIAAHVYSCIDVVNPSNAGVTPWFVSQTVAALIADINS